MYRDWYNRGAAVARGTREARAVNSSDTSITKGSFPRVTPRGTRSASTAFDPRGELLAVHTALGAACTASESARSAEALEQESVPRHVTSMCQPTQSIMTCEDRGRTDVTSARNVVSRCVSAGPGPAETHRATTFRALGTCVRPRSSHVMMQCAGRQRIVTCLGTSCCSSASTFDGTLTVARR